VNSSSHSFGLFVQSLDDQDKALVLGQVASLRHSPQRFVTGDLKVLCDALRVPKLSNPGVTLRRAEAKNFTRSYEKGLWALTPVGDKRVRVLLQDIDVLEIEAALASEGSVGALLADVRHALLPPTFAPPRWGPGIARMLERFPFDQNVLCMTRFPSGDPSDPVRGAIDQLRESCAEHGLHLHLASEQQFEDDLLGNVGAYMWACRYGVGIAEDRVGRGLNENTLIELGAMVMTGRRCSILRDVTIDELPSDLAGHIYKPVDLDDRDSVARAITQWIQDDLDFQPLG
jgi:hypothetical protein